MPEEMSPDLRDSPELESAWADFRTLSPELQAYILQTMDSAEAPAERPAQEPAMTEKEELVMREKLAKDISEAAFVLARQVIGQELQLRPELAVDSAREAINKISSQELNALTAQEKSQLEADITEAAFVLARHVIDQEIRLRPELVVNSVRGALLLIAPGNNTIHLNPADLPIVEQARDDLKKVGLSTDAPFVADDKIERGGCIIKNENGSVDTQPSSKFEQLKRAAEA